MADTGKQSPLGVNALGSLLNNQGLTLNPILTTYIGTSNSNYNYSLGSLVSNSALKWLTYAINDAYIRSGMDKTTQTTVDQATYGNLISIGSGTIPSLGNSLSPGYSVIDPSGVWTTEATTNATNAGITNPLPGPATSGFAIDSNLYQGQYATWYPYNLTNPNSSITQWGFLRLFALQGFNEFNYNGGSTYNNMTLTGVSITGTKGQFSCDPSNATLRPGQQVVISGVNTGSGSITGYTDPTTYTILNTNGSTTFQLENVVTVAGTPIGYTYTVNTEDYYSYASVSTSIQYKEFLGSFATADAFINSTNQAINSLNNSKEFLDGTFSNMNDLITGDVSGVSLALQPFGADLINLGGVIDLSKLSQFGLPSILLKTLLAYNAITEDLNVALLSSGLELSEILSILETTTEPSVEQEQKIYSAFLLIQGENLKQVLIPLNCRTQNLNSLADLLNIQKLFPLSYSSLTVPVYNTTPGPTNSKTYYLIYQGNNTNSGLNNPSIVEQVGTQLPPGPPANNTPNVPSPTTITNTVVTTTSPEVIQSSTQEVSQVIRQVGGGIRRETGRQELN